MRRATLSLLAVFALGACADTDVPETGGEVAPGEEREETARAVEPVDLEALPWVRDGGILEFQDQRWRLEDGPAVFDPAVEYVGEARGTPLYAEVGSTGPHGRLYIPLEGDYWRILRPGGAVIPADTLPTEAEVMDTAESPGGG